MGLDKHSKHHDYIRAVYGAHLLLTGSGLCAAYSVPSYYNAKSVGKYC